MNAMRWWRSLQWQTQALLLVVAISFILRVSLALAYAPAGDSCWYESVGSHVAATGMFPDFELLGRDVFSYPPLYPLLAGALEALSGTHAAFRLVVPLASAASLLAVFAVLRRITTPTAALLGTAFLAILPLHAYQGYLSMLEAPSLLLIALTLHFLFTGRVALSALFFGLNGLTILTWPAAIPAVLYYLWSSSSSALSFIRQSALYGALSSLVMLPWWLRNYSLFGNPVYPAAEGIFGGPALAYASTQFFAAPQFNPAGIPVFIYKSFLGLAGVPNGDPAALSLLPLPAIALWAAAMVFLLAIPFLSLHRLKLRDARIQALIILFVSYVLLTYALFLIPRFGVHIRYILPALLLPALLAGLSLERIWRMKKLRIVLLALAVLFFLGIAAQEVAKVSVGSSWWHAYDDDYAWVEQNIPESAIILTPADQCYAHYFNRQTANHDALVFLESVNASHVFVNEQFVPAQGRFLPEEKEAVLEGATLVYNNSETGTLIYQR